MYSTDNILNTLSGTPGELSDVSDTTSNVAQPPAFFTGGAGAANVDETNNSENHHAPEPEGSAYTETGDHAPESDGPARPEKDVAAPGGDASDRSPYPVLTVPQAQRAPRGPRPGHFLHHLDPVVRDRLVAILSEQTADVCDLLVGALRQHGSPLYIGVSDEDLCSSIGILYEGYVELIRTGNPARLGSLSADIVRTRLAQGFELADMEESLGAWRTAILPRVIATFATEPAYLTQAVDSLMRTEELASVCMAEAYQDVAAEQLQAAHEETLRAEHEKVVFCREMARVATHEKLILCDAADVPSREGVQETPLMNPREVRDARHAALAAARRIGWDEERSYSLQLCIGEAGTNAIRHAGGAVFQVWSEGDAITFRLADRGPGIDFYRIPTALRSGYSTGSSLGMGFTLMLEVADRIELATDATGTIIQITLQPTPRTAGMPPPA